MAVMTERKAGLHANKAYAAFEAGDITKAEVNDLLTNLEPHLSAKQLMKWMDFMGS